MEEKNRAEDLREALWLAILAWREEILAMQDWSKCSCSMQMFYVWYISLNLVACLGIKTIIQTWGIEYQKIKLLNIFRYHGSIAYYGMRREEIRDQGYVLAVPDEYLKSCKVGNVLFRVWFQVKYSIISGVKHSLFYYIFFTQSDLKTMFF